jgi:hypothetical protein
MPFRPDYPARVSGEISAAASVTKDFPAISEPKLQASRYVGSRGLLICCNSCIPFGNTCMYEALNGQT